MQVYWVVSIMEMERENFSTVQSSGHSSSIAVRFSHHTTIKLKTQIKSVQRRATKYILGYLKDINCKQRLIRSWMLPLDYRQEVKGLVCLFKSRSGSLDINHPKFFQPVSQNPRYKTRKVNPYNYKIIWWIIISLGWPHYGISFLKTAEVPYHLLFLRIILY